MQARLGQLAALVLDFVKQPHVLDRDCGLVRESLDKGDLLFGERTHGGARQRYHADRGSFPQQRNTEHRSNAGAQSGGNRIFGVSLDIVNMSSLSFEQDPPDN